MQSAFLIRASVKTVETINDMMIVRTDDGADGRGERGIVGVVAFVVQTIVILMKVSAAAHAETSTEDRFSFAPLAHLLPSFLSLSLTPRRVLSSKGP